MVMIVQGHKHGDRHPDGDHVTCRDTEHTSVWYSVHTTWLIVCCVCINNNVLDL